MATQRPGMFTGLTDQDVPNPPDAGKAGPPGGGDAAPANVTGAYPGDGVGPADGSDFAGGKDVVRDHMAGG
jgi:hypothetical protein